MMKIVTVLIKSIKDNVGLEIGIGAKGKINVKGVDVEAGAVAAISDAVTYSEGEFDIKTTGTVNTNLAFGQILKISYKSGKEHSVFDCKCNCNVLREPFSQRMNCVASTPAKDMEATFGISVGIYILFGGEISVGIDVKKLFKEWKGVLKELYESLY